MRLYQYVPQLEAAGFRVTICPLLDDRYLKSKYGNERVSLRSLVGAYARRVLDVLRARRFDLVLIEKELFPWVPGPVEQLLLSGVPYVVDYDDAIFHSYDQHPSRAVRWSLGRKIAGLMRAAKLVIAGNEYLAGYAQDAGAPRVAILPTAIELERYRERAWKEESAFTVGWIGSPSTARYVALVAPALEEACRGGGRLVVIGADKLDLAGVATTYRPWTEAGEAEEISKFDVGIMPLPDGPWERGKCGYKLIQYMASGVPVVASPVGVNSALVEAGVNGFLPTGMECWSHALCSLRDQVDLRRLMGSNGRRKVEQQYCTAVVAPQLVSLLSQAMR